MVPAIKPSYRPDEIATKIGCCKRTIYRMISDGRLNAIKHISGAWRIILNQDQLPHQTPKEQL